MKRTYDGALNARIINFADTFGTSEDNINDHTVIGSLKGIYDLVDNIDNAVGTANDTVENHTVIGLLKSITYMLRYQ